MSDTKKVALEAANFENFLHVGQIKFDRHGPQCSPEPDRVAYRGEREFGVEITGFYRQIEKGRESEEARTIEMAFEIYQRRGGPHLMLSAMWAPHFTVQKKDRTRLAEKIADVVINHPPLDQQWLTLDWHHFDSDLMLAIDHIAIYRLPNSSHGHWAVAAGGAVPEWDVISLQRELDRKKDKPRHYCRRYEEIWLLLVSAFGAPSAWMEVTDEVRNAEFHSPYDKVFLLSSFPLEVIELNVVRFPA